MPVSAACSRYSEQRKGAAVEIFRRSKPKKISGNRKSHAGAAAGYNLIYAGMAE